MAERNPRSPGSPGNGHGGGPAAEAAGELLLPGRGGLREAGGKGGKGGGGDAPLAPGEALPYRTRMQNIVVLGLAAFLQFTAYLTIQNFETSVLGDEGNEVMVTGFFVHIAGSFISPWFVAKLGHRWALFVSNLTYVGMVAGNLQPSIAFLAFLWALGGVGGGVWWTAHGEFLMGPACTGPHISFDRASGIFFGIYQFSGVVGNGLAALLLRWGVSFNVLVIIMAILCIDGGFSFFLLKEVPRKAAAPGHNEGLAAVQWMWDWRAKYMWALMTYWGLAQSFFFGQLPRGVPTMTEKAIVMACWSGANVVGSFLIGKFSNTVGRTLLLFATTVLHFVALIQTNIAENHVHGSMSLGPYIAAGLISGLADSGLTTMIYAITGDVFSDCTAAAYAALSALRVLGSATGFFLEIILKGPLQVYLIVCMLVLLVIGMVTTHALLRKVDKKTAPEIQRRKRPRKELPPLRHGSKPRDKYLRLFKSKSSGVVHKRLQQVRGLAKKASGRAKHKFQKLRQREES